MFTPEVWFGLGALALLAVLICARVQSKRRNGANDPLTEAASRGRYDRSGAYTREQAHYRAQIGPS